MTPLKRDTVEILACIAFGLAIAALVGAALMFSLR